MGYALCCQPKHLMPEVENLVGTSKKIHNRTESYRLGTVNILTMDDAVRITALPGKSL